MGSKSSGREILYCYIDHDKRRQGPFTERQMVQWYESGYFSDSLELEVFEIAERLTLLSLKTRNGIMSPFKWLEQPSCRNRMPVNVRSAGTQTYTTTIPQMNKVTQTNFYQPSAGVQTDMKLVGVPAPLLFPLKPPGLNNRPLTQASKTPHNSNPAPSLSHLSHSQRPAIPVQSRSDDLTSQSPAYPDSSKNREKHPSTYSGEFLPVVNSESSRASSSTSSDLIAAFVPFMFGHTNFKPAALLKGPAFEKAIRKLRVEFTGMTQEHRERFYKKLEELGIPPKMMCKLCNRGLSNYYDYMNHTLSDKHHVAVEETKRSFIDQDYATLQNAIRRTAGHDWIEPVNLGKDLNFLSF
ncbi:hypothetical protein WR25_12296 isoform B [Diploscapter pachys]|uniref:GYF domain-containing protein n=1 Tax=Diploscapter pachys TaxID=2018661 RepID=A0A2A2JVA0_9BILA|nr:hypothetical protein WR25_12296 isoform B [Diploscapter pachys]